ncbi:MAG TPA: methyltransferase domain-containing protein [Candidatus Acidoferrales bacterium]|nr:methyltransferase domain-containing protein [Candidatus Acidoferrales bacterium]
MISLVVPTYNERASIARLVERTGAALAQCGEDYELIIVDDGSPDGTAEEVERLAAEGRPWLRVHVRRYERDLSTAVVAGWRIARGDVLGCMDADLQHPPELLPRLLAALRNSPADVAVGSRHVAGGGVSQWSLWRRFVSWTATLMAAGILPGTLGKVSDPMSGFFVMRAGVIRQTALSPIGYKILLEVLARGSYERIAEVPYVFEERAVGGSKMTMRTAVQYIAHLVRISVDSGEATRLARYALVGASGAVINVSLTLGVFLTRLEWPLLAAALGGAGFAMGSNFFWNEYFTFHDAHRAQPGGARILLRFLKFCAFSVTGVAISLAVIAALHYGLHAGFGWSIVLGVLTGGVWNFFMNSNVTWAAWWNRQLLSRVAQPPVPVGRAATMVYVPCNLCGSAEYKVLYAGRASSVAALSEQAFRCTSLQHGDFTNIVQCSRCGLLYENPREPEEIIETRYEQVEDAVYEREKEGRVRTYQGMMPAIEKYSSPPGRVLDIGCYLGVFLDVARRRGWQTVGVEPSAWAAQRTREQGHQVINAPLRRSNLPAASFDLITLWDVIEHLHDPLGQLREIHSLLRPGGAFALTTMDTGSLYAKMCGRRWPWYMRMHLYYFTRGTLARMLEEAGFEVLEIARARRIVSLRYFLEKAGAVLRPVAPLLELLAVPFGSLYISVDFGDNIIVLARKFSPAP